MLLSSQDCKLMVTECLGGLGGRCCVVALATTAAAVALLPAFLLPHFQIKANAVFSLQELWLLNAAVCSQTVIQKQNQAAVFQNQTDWKIVLTANETAPWKKKCICSDGAQANLNEQGWTKKAVDERQAETGSSVLHMAPAWLPPVLVLMLFPYAPVEPLVASQGITVETHHQLRLHLTGRLRVAGSGVWLLVVTAFRAKN